MEKEIKACCASCETKECRSGKDCFGRAGRDLELYEELRLGGLHRAASAVEARYYCKANRLQEVILFAAEMKFNRLGLVFCIGLAEEARIVEQILKQDFEVISVCCKVCGVPKKKLNLEQIDPESESEVICNPAGQAQLCNEAGTELNIVCGLCVGHDAVFSMRSDAPVTTLITKDRLLAHNPAGAIYSQYLRRTFTAGRKI